MPDEKRYYVYTLAYPESMGGHVFYVGCGTGARIKVHEGDAMRRHCTCRKCEIIRGIYEAKEQVATKKVAFFDMRVKALLSERDLISRLKSEGHPLTNTKSGDVLGSGSDRTEEELQKREEQWEAILRRRAAATRRYYAQRREEKRLQSSLNNRDNRDTMRGEGETRD